MFLEEHNYFEESFKVRTCFLYYKLSLLSTIGKLFNNFNPNAVNIFQAYERGIALFRWPNVYDIWNTYLTKFIDRYGGKKLERARDLFEQALDGCPAKFAKSK